MTPKTHDPQRGSALVLALLVVVVLTVLGVAFVVMAQIENRIAESERLSAQALFVSEAAARVVIRWFDLPDPAAGFAFPPVEAVDRSLRAIDEDGDPATPAHRQDGSAWPVYKQGVDRNADGEEDLFDRPFRSDRRDAFLGTEDGPDLRIDGDRPGPGRDLLERLCATLLAGHPGAGTGARARIARIEVYAPPSLRVAGAWVRQGIATLKVVARMEREADAEVLAEKTLRAVVAEIPYSIPYGPLHSCGDLWLPGALRIHWGAVTALGEARLDEDHASFAASLPRVASPSPRLDLLWAHDDDGAFSAYRAAVEGRKIEDPWLRILAGGALSPAPGAALQPQPFTWTPGTALGSGDLPAHEPGRDGSHSNLFQHVAEVRCPEFDYDLWKSIATSGRPGVEYYVWDSGDLFRRDGTGTPRSFREISDLDPASPERAAALLFFDTRDDARPHDDDADGVYDNLTPPLVVEGGVWSSRGLLYVNAERLRISGVAGRPAFLRAPGEPFQDRDGDGSWEAGEEWINLRYPLLLGGDLVADGADGVRDDGGGAGAPVRNSQGPPVAGDLAMDGILYTSGRLDPGAGAIHRGSLIAAQGVAPSDPALSGLEVYWDQRIGAGAWPPPEWNLPRVTVVAWRTTP